MIQNHMHQKTHQAPLIHLPESFYWKIVLLLLLHSQFWWILCIFSLKLSQRHWKSQDKDSFMGTSSSNYLICLALRWSLLLIFSGIVLFFRKPTYFMPVWKSLTSLLGRSALLWKAHPSSFGHFSHKNVSLPLTDQKQLVCSEAVDTGFLCY